MGVTVTKHASVRFELKEWNTNGHHCLRATTTAKLMESGNDKQLTMYMASGSSVEDFFSLVGGQCL